MVALRAFAVLVLFTVAPPARSADPIDYNRDIRPILSGSCFACHGADAGQREADLRLDVRDEATGTSDDGAAIVPGNPEESPFLERITSTDESDVMPPADSGKSLTPEQVELLTRWIASGAEYDDHWAFTAPVRPDLPELPKSARIHNPIDSYVQARLEHLGLNTSPLADPQTWLRRVYLDLIGLPPEPDAIHRFLNAYENAGDDAARERVISDRIDALLASPHYGEKWGREWLDAARYADSDGFEKDKPRTVWFYRDWVINALNADQPYNEFIIEQIAGDLLPNAGQDQIVATGFLRNSMINEEGGVDPEQFRMEAMFDRMDAIGKAFLGLTIQCGQCHSHKYDPLTQTDYYRMFAFLNNCHEGSITVYTTEERKLRSQLLTAIRQIERQLKESLPDWEAQMDAWVQSVRAAEPSWTIVRPELDASGGQKHYLLEEGSILAQGYAPTKHTTTFTVDTAMTTLTALRLELLNDPNLPHGGPGRAPDGLCALTEFQTDVTPLGNGGKTQNVKFAAAYADANPPDKELDLRYYDKSDKRRVTGPVGYATDGDNLTAWGIDIGGGRSNMPRQAVFTLEQPVQNAAGFRITFKLVQMHGGWNSDDNQNNNLGRFRFSVTDADGIDSIPVPAALQEIVALNPAQRTPEQTAQLFRHWRTTRSDWQAANDEIESLWQKHPRGTSQLVAQERRMSRKTSRLERGSFLSPVEPVSPGVPEFMHPLEVPKGRTPTRLDFARWLADPRSPTVARAIINRIWQSYFGVGFVETSEDLGTQGELPSHPQLLDWLAMELMENDWSLKHIHRLICRSATYRQSSHVTPELLARDPYNRLLARGPRFRLPAEQVRDIALAASGLLNRDVGGPSVYPPAPAFLFAPPASYGPKTWRHDTGSERYRRALYTFRFRSVPYPVLQNFDAPNGDVACARRPRSNTPLQALTTLNEPLFMECAQALALKAIREGGTSDSEKLQYAFERCLARRPDDQETSTLMEFLDAQRQRFAEHAEPSKILADESPSLPEGTSPQEAASWTALARVLLNLDETITKE